MKKKNISEKSTNSRRRRPEKITRRSEKIVHTYDSINMCLKAYKPEDQSVMNIEDSIEAVESILMYTFNDKRLLEQALTHSSYTDAPSYQRLEFLGDSALGLAVSSFFFLTYPDVDAGKLSDLRSANVSNEKLARAAVHHGLHKYIRHNKATVLNDKVREFLIEVEEEEEMVVHGGQMKAPKVLADVVESVAAAVYVDCRFNLQMMWMITRRLLEPLVMLDVVLAQPQPIMAMYEACQKNGKQIDIRYHRSADRIIASVFVDDVFIASGSSETKENAKLHAAEAALLKLTDAKLHAAEAALLKLTDANAQVNADLNDVVEAESAKQKVRELCDKKKWPKPTYRLEQELGPSHDKRYVSSVQVELFDTTFFVKGMERCRVKDAENSAASMMFRALRESGYA